MKIENPIPTIDRRPGEDKNRNLPTADELYPEGYIVIQNNNGGADEVIPSTETIEWYRQEVTTH